VGGGRRHRDVGADVAEAAVSETEYGARLVRPDRHGHRELPDLVGERGRRRRGRVHRRTAAHDLARFEARPAHHERALLGDLGALSDSDAGTP
jgi:hypothetical protein